MNYFGLPPHWVDQFIIHTVTKEEYMSWVVSYDRLMKGEGDQTDLEVITTAASECALYNEIYDG